MTWYCFIRQTKHAWQAYIALNRKYEWMDCLAKRNMTVKFKKKKNFRSVVYILSLFKIIIIIKQWSGGSLAQKKYIHIKNDIAYTYSRK